MNHIPRTMKKLEKAGLVEEKIMHIDGSKRRKKVYFLTWDGNRHAREMFDRLCSEKITVLENGSKKKMTVGEALAMFKKAFPDERTPVFTILENISGKVLDFEALEPSLPPEEEVTELVNFSDKAPKIRYFFGREKELEICRMSIETEGPQVLIISGIAGIGKTTFAAKIVSLYQSKFNVFWYQFQEWDTPRNVLLSLSDFLYQAGRKKLRSYMHSKDSVNMSEVFLLLSEDMKNLSCILVFDDCQKVMDTMVVFLSSLLETARRSENINYILLGREIPRIYDRRDVRLRNLVEEINLGGLDENSSRKLLEARNVKIRNFKEIHRLTGGHPLSLELMEPGSESRMQSDIRRFIRDEIYANLNPLECRVLEALCVYRYPVSPRAMLFEDEITYDEIDALIFKHLISETSFDEYVTHDLIREFFYQRLTPAGRKHYHGLAGDYYSQETGNAATLEEQYHLFKAGKKEKAAGIALSSGRKLMNDGYAHQLDGILSLFEESDIDSREWANILRLKGEVADLLGKWDDATSLFGQAAELAEKEGDRELLAELNRELGSVHDKLGEWDTALGYLNSGLDILGDGCKSIPAAKFYRNISEIQLKMGETESATIFCQMSIDICEKENDPNELARNFNVMGAVQYSLGNWDKAIEHYEKCLELWSRLDNRPGLASVYNNLGVIFRRKNDWERASEHQLKGMEIREKIGDVRGIANSNINIGLLNFDKGQWDKAIEHYCNAREILQKIGDTRGLVTVYINMGVAHRNKGDLDKALDYYKRSMELLEKMGDIKGLAGAYINQGFILRQRGDLEAAKELFTRALDCYGKVGDSHGTALSYYNLGDVFFEMSDPRESEKMYLKSITISEESGYKEILAGDYRGLGDICAARGEEEKAVEHCTKALELVKKTDDKVELAKIRRSLGMVYKRKKDYKSADMHFKESIDILGDLKNFYDLGKSYLEIGQMEKERRNKRKAVKNFNLALRSFRKVDSKSDILAVEKQLENV